MNPDGFGAVDIARAIAVMAVIVLLAGTRLERREVGPAHPEPPPPDAPRAPITAEADVFRTRAAGLGVLPDFPGDQRAHARTLEMYRGLRAYPGAPPRIPHGLTDEEFRMGRCNSCHLRGGWAARFGNYAPVTPHPDLGQCVQCHVPRDELVGRALPGSEASVVCEQCHVDPDRTFSPLVPSDWRTTPWPSTDVHALDGGPTLVPHDLESRANCLACHGGPGAVTSLRTDHPERINCRQCHVAVLEASSPGFEPVTSGGGPGGSP